MLSKGNAKTPKLVKEQNYIKWQIISEFMNKNKIIKIKGYYPKILKDFLPNKLQKFEKFENGPNPYIALNHINSIV